MRTLGGTLLALMITHGLFWAGCGGDPAEKIVPGMTFADVTDLLGEPEIRRQGTTFVDSNGVAMMVRGSEIPVINFSALDSKILWLYEQSRTDTGVFTRGPGGPSVRFVTVSRFGVVFDAQKGTVVARGYYPLSVVRAR